MAVLEVQPLPDLPSAAAAVFHLEYLPRAAALLDTSPKGENMVLIFLPADHTHRGWRLAAVQGLARESAPRRVNAIASDNAAAIGAALTYLNAAGGVTGQYLQLDDAGASPVVLPPI